MKLSEWLPPVGSSSAPQPRSRQTASAVLKELEPEGDPVMFAAEGWAEEPSQGLGVNLWAAAGVGLVILRVDVAFEARRGFGLFVTSATSSTDVHPWAAVARVLRLRRTAKGAQPTYSLSFGEEAISTEDSVDLLALFRECVRLTRETLTR